jgi:replicative superfamily II helicase
MEDEVAAEMMKNTYEAAICGECKRVVCRCVDLEESELLEYALKEVGLCVYECLHGLAKRATRRENFFSIILEEAADEVYSACKLNWKFLEAVEPRSVCYGAIEEEELDAIFKRVLLYVKDNRARVRDAHLMRCGAQAAMHLRTCQIKLSQEVERCPYEEIETIYDSLVLLLQRVSERVRTRARQENPRGGGANVQMESIRR